MSCRVFLRSRCASCDSAVCEMLETVGRLGSSSAAVGQCAYPKSLESACQTCHTHSPLGSQNPPALHQTMLPSHQPAPWAHSIQTRIGHVDRQSLARMLHTMQTT